MLFKFGVSPRSHPFAPQLYPLDHKTGNYGQYVTKPATNAMKVEVDGPTSIAERSDSMHPPSPRKQGLTTSPSSYNKQPPALAEQGGKRRQSRFDPMGGDVDEEGYGDMGNRHTFRKISEDEKISNFTLPGIKSLLNPSSDREQAPTTTSSTSTSNFHSPSLPSLTSNSPGGSPSTLRSSRYSSLASGSSLGDNHNGWWAPTFERNNSQASASRASPIPPSLYLAEDNDAKRRRSDQSPVSRDLEEQTRMRYLAQSRNASFPMTTPGTCSGPSSPRHELRMMHPPAPPNAANARGSVSYNDSITNDRRPSAVPRSLSVVSGPLSRSFADLTANERDREKERQGSMASEMLPPGSAHQGPERRGSSLSISEIQRQRANTATPPERFRAQTNPPGPNSPRLAQHRSSLSELIKAQSGDNVNMASGRYESVPLDKNTSEPGPTGWLPSRRSSASSTRSASTPGMTVNLNSDDGHSHPQSRPRPFHPSAPHGQAPPDSMSGMDVLAESARRVSEEEEHRRIVPFPGEDPEDSPKPGQAGPKYQCAYCTKTFSRPSSLRIHTYSHTGERPFVCQEPSCGRRFSVQSNLKRHAKVHQLGQAGGASLHQLHPTSGQGHSGPGSGMQLPPPGAHGHSHNGHGYYAQGGYGYDNRYPPAPYPQPHQPQGPPGHQGQRPYVDPRFEEDELDEEEMDEDEPRA